ncbi:MAG TPA: tetratricopeptide repeat protein [Chthonomonadaceae bacterium]|nr:tetratricopeptide repeat protein [Chthonomonadaceae bacterium]
MPDLPTGTVSFLFTDIEGSTRLWERHRDAMSQAIARHDALLRACIETQGGYVFKTVGDAFCAAFSSAHTAIATALAAQQVLQSEIWPAKIGTLRVRMALHTGEAVERDDDYFGPPLNQVARLLAIGHGEQVLLSRAIALLAEGHLPQPLALRDMGRHLLKDLQAPEQIYQLLHPELREDFPPLRSLNNLPNNLPCHLSTFIGRAKEMEEVSRLLASQRLLTLTGSGGCGKTRLALQVAADLLDTYQDGVFLVELAALSEEGLISQQIASALGLREQTGQGLIETLIQYLKDRKALLLLDNCEHLLDACASIVETLLHSCSDLSILTTSQEALHMPGEQVWKVPSLRPPDPDLLLSKEQDLPAVLQEYDACRLFAVRAASQCPDFRLTRQNGLAVARICRHLDGIPLAIELAAAQVRVMTPEQIANRLNDRFRLLRSGSRTAPTRQYTLKATLDWSYDQMNEEDQQLLERLSVFAGGWTLEAMEAIGSGEDIAEGEVLDLLCRLVDKNLVLYEESGGESRYRLLETVRQYAAARLAEAGQTRAYRMRHRDYFYRMAKETRPGPTGPEQAHRMRLLEREYDNLRAALDFCLKGSDQTADARVGIRLAAELPTFWEVSGRCTEGRDYLERALAHPGAEPTTSEHAQVLEGAGVLAFRQGDFDRASRHHNACMELRRLLKDTVGAVHSLRHLGNVEEDRGDYGRAEALYTEALRLVREVEEPGLEGLILCDLGSVAWMQGDYAQAKNHTLEGLALQRRLGNRRGIAFALYNLGHIAVLEDDYAQAHAYQAESLTLWQEQGSKLGIIFSLEDFAEQAQAQGWMERAARLYAMASLLREKIGEPLPLSRRKTYERNLAAIRTALGEAAYTALWTKRHADSPEQSIAYALERPA